MGLEFVIILFYTFFKDIYTLFNFKCLKKVRFFFNKRDNVQISQFSLKFIIIFFIIILFFLLSTLWYFSIGLPDYKKLSNYQPPISSRVYSNDGKLIAEYALEKRLFVPYDSIPEKVINSFLSAEDKNFFFPPRS